MKTQNAHPAHEAAQKSVMDKCDSYAEVNGALMSQNAALLIALRSAAEKLKSAGDHAGYRKAMADYYANGGR